MTWRRRAEFGGGRGPARAEHDGDVEARRCRCGCGVRQPPRRRGPADRSHRSRGSSLRRPVRWNARRPLSEYSASRSSSDADHQRYLNAKDRRHRRQEPAAVRYCEDARSHRVRHRRGSGHAQAWRPDRVVALDSRRAGTRLRRTSQLRQDAGAGRRTRLRDHRRPRRIGHRVPGELRKRAAGHRRLRGVRRAARHRTRVRAQHHRGVGGRHGAGVGGGRRRTRPHRRAARHARRGGGRRKGVAAQRRCVRRRRRHGDAARRAARHRPRAVAGAVAGGGQLHWAAKRTPPSRRIWGSTPPTPSPSRRWPSACCANRWSPGT